MSDLDFQSLHPALRDYVVQVKRQLHGLVPNSNANALLQDTAYWIQRQAKQLEYEGMSSEQAMRHSIESDESPRVAAIRLIEDYFESKENGLLIKRLGRANAIVFCVFGLATGLHLLLLEFVVSHPASKAINSLWSPGVVHRYYPDGLPFPEMNWQFLATVAIPVLGPWFLGWVSGRLIPVRASSAVALGLAPLILFSVLVAVSLLPDRSAIFYASLQVFYWLPVGCLTAHLSSTRYDRNT